MTVQGRSIRRQPNLSHQVYEAVRESIATGQLEPGERIVLEHVAQNLGVSPTPVREALGRLLQEGLIQETSPGRLQVLELTPQHVLDTFLVRSVLEGLSAELATPRLAEADLARLDQALTEVEVALQQGEYETHWRADALLHRIVRESADNAVLYDKLEALRTQVDCIRVYSRRHAGEHIQQSHVEHRGVLAALASRDPDVARRVMESHIRQSGIRITHLIALRTIDTREAAL